MRRGGKDKNGEVTVLVGDDEESGPFWTLEQLPSPYKEMIELLYTHNEHPVRKWFEKLGNGFFEDDWGVSLPCPQMTYRFRKEEQVAYIWETNDGWHVVPWRIRGKKSKVIKHRATFRAALDALLRQPRPWWRFWSR